MKTDKLLGNTELLKKMTLEIEEYKRVLEFVWRTLLLLNYIADRLSRTDENIFRVRGALLLICQIPAVLIVWTG